MDASKEKLLNDTYEKFMDVALFGNGSLDMLSEMAAQDIMGFGTTVDEKILSLSEFRNLLNRQREQGQDLQMQWKIVPAKHRISMDGNSAVIADHVSAVFTINNEALEMVMRFSIVFEFRKGRWLVVHFHGSKPENVESETDTFGIEEWKQKNAQLEKLVSEKTAELQISLDELKATQSQLKEQNQELQIEASLERVRSTAMAMHSSDELGKVVSVVLKNLHDLGFVAENGAAAHLIIFNSETKDFVQWSADPFLDKPVRARIPYAALTILSDFFEEKEKGLNFFTKVYPREQKDEFFEYAFEHSDLKHLPDELKQLILASETYTHWMAIEENSAISVNSMTGGQLSGSQIDILMRFARVFEQAYTRFLDLQKAEEQAREAQIEAALERVRSRTMAMRHSDELSEAAAVLFEQFNILGEGPERMAIEIVNEKENVFEIWATQHGGSQLDLQFKASLDEPHVMQKMYRAWKEKTKSITIDLQGNELEEYFLYLKKEGLPVKREVFGQRRVQNVATFSKGILTIITPEPRPAETIRLLERFASVFEQTYTRFLDLQKAETQAREAQIELSLERIRARSMAMHKSDELVDTSVVLFQELKTLGVQAIRTGVAIIDDEKETMELWSSQLLEQKQNKVLGLVHMDVHPFFKELLHAWRRKDPGYVYEMKGNEVSYYYETMASILSYPSQKNFNPREIFNPFFFPEGSLTVVTHQHLSGEERDIMLRFARVFGLLYRRFLDLQKAEAQAKEAQIEAAMERVRSRTMGMQKSDELKEVIQVVYDQFVILKMQVEHTGFIMDYQTRDDMHIWLADSHAIPFQVTIPYFDCAHWNSFNEAKKKGIDFFANQLDFEEKNKFYKDLFQLVPGVTEEASNYYFNSPGLAISTVLLDNVGLYIENFSGIPYTDEENKTLMRFGKVFQQTYTRFLDLQKAETQAREAKIEAALERVRAKSMAMHKSEELQELSFELVKQVQALGVPTWHCAFNIYDADQKSSTEWGSNAEGSFPIYKTPREGIFLRYFEIGQTGSTLHIEEIGEEKCADHYEYLCTLPGVGEQLIRVRDSGIAFPTSQIDHVAYFKYGYLLFITFEPAPGAHEIFRRFAKVFEQSYTRFLDLKKAEAQARESQIEASLERIRAKAMAMHRSEEIDEVLEVLFDQFDVLGIVPVSTHLTLIDIESNSFTFRETGKGGRKSFGEQKVPIDSMEIWKEAADRWKALDPLSLNKLHFPKESLPMVWQVFHESFASMPEGHKITPEDYPDGIYHTAGNCKFGYIGMNHVRPATEEEEQIVLKFAVEFGRLYQRYLDLQKAEAQTKEAKIETAIERVRSASLAMHKSEELKYVIKVVFDNLDPLGLKNIDAVIINILHPGSRDFDLWLAVQGQNYSWNFPLAHFDHPIANDFFKAVEQGETLHRKIYSFELKNSYFRYMFEHADNKYLPAERKAFILKGPGYAVSAGIARYSSILIQNYRGIPFSDEENSIVMRFSKVFDQTYTRFLDLQKVEAQEREARIEVSLERVRSKAMAMHSSQDLADTIVAFYHELESFSITPRRCGVGLINKSTRIAELSTMNTTGDGKSIEIIGTLKMSGHPVLEGVYDNWLVQKEYHPVLRGPEIPAYYQMLKPQISFPDYPDDAVQYGYFFYFPEGGVYAWTEKEMVEDELIIYRRFTSVLSLTYKRYKDLQQAEDLAKQAADDLVNLKLEKKKTEDALTELKLTQSQLVQAEKMASLGELTAGIAHEIQNPLNFVNNFSDLSSELLEEMKQQLEIGNKQEAIEIVEDIKQNLEKILHHGKRADSIVKGMLQHSRSKSGQKEITDINNLADEYLRLAYHGLRAKDKSFNADLKTDFDNNVGKLEIIPQDIGRVLVNLLNNAFYTVNERRKKEVKEYEPIVLISTRKKGNRVELSVKDNGTGIPKESLEKIFQPFFTTKPTGQGTGLGLSLSYDIIKAHGGNLQVKTIEGEGTEFIITLG